MQNLQQTLVEERDKILQNANQQRSMLEESLHSTKSEEHRLKTKLAEAEEVGVLVRLFSVFPINILFFVRIVKLWNELPGDKVEADSFQLFKS